MAPTQAAQGVPELVLVGLLYGSADMIKANGCIPRAWADESADLRTHSE